MSHSAMLNCSLSPSISLNLNIMRTKYCDILVKHIK